MKEEELQKLKAAATALDGWHWPDRKRDPDTGEHSFGQWKEGEFYELGTIDGAQYTCEYADDIRLLKFLRLAQPTAILKLIERVESQAATQAPSAPVAPDERAAFETEMRDMGACDFTLRKWVAVTEAGPTYQNQIVQDHWRIWQARAALSVQAETAASAEDIRKRLMFAAVDCGHSIAEDRITLHRDKAKEGNALHQLVERIVLAAAPTPPTTGGA